MKKLVPILFAIAGVCFLVPSAISLIKGEPLEGVFLVLGFAFITLSLVFAMVGRRKS